MNYRIQNKLLKKILAVMMLMVTMFASVIPSATYAADDDVGVGTKVKLSHVKEVRYGEGYTGLTHMMKASGLDDSLGERYIFCVQPHLLSPDAGTYTIDKMYASDSGNSGMLRKLVYYANGYPGFSKGKEMWFSSGDWSNDDIFGIFHVALSYVTAGYNDDMMGTVGYTVKSKMYTSYWNKMKEIVEDCKSDTKVPDPPAGFKVFYIINSGKQNVIGGTLENGELTLTKESANKTISDGNAAYSLEGAEFSVYKGSNKVATLTTKADGTSNTVELEAGKYTVKETKVPLGYAKEDDKTVTVQAGRKATVSFSDQPKNNPIELLLQKGDAETMKAEPQGSGTLEGAIYEVKYYKKTSNGETLDRTWRFKTDKEGIVKFNKDYLDTSFDNSDFYYSSAKKETLPIGKVTIQEIEAPEGYLLNDTIYTSNITDDGETDETLNTFKAPVIGSDSEVAEKPKRGDLEFVKVGDGTMDRLAGVPFKITSITTGESHTIVTDKNGYASTNSLWNKHSSNTNRGKTSEDGIWFGAGAVDDSRGALLYDDYELEELSCDANKGKNLLKVKVSIYKDSVTIPLGTMTDDDIEVETTAKDDETKSHLGKAEKTVYIVDTVKYSGLKKGTTYKLTGTLMNKETGAPIEKDGKPITAEKTFTAKSTSGEVEVEFKVDGELLKGKSVVVFEDLYQDDIKIAIHADIEDEGQTVYYPDVKTTAKDSETNEGVSNADKEVTIVDTVAYSGLMPGKEYTVKGTIMDKDTGKALKVGDKEVTSEATFTAEKSDGTVDVTFTFDGSALKGKSVVVFENLIYRGKEIAVHADINDEGQTVYFPDVKTQAEDAETKLPLSNADEDVTVIDTVKYSDLKPGKEYTLSGTLMNKATGKPIVDKDNKEVTAETKFTPEKSSGEVQVTFKFSAVNLNGNKIVAFEKLFYEGIEVAAHTDINDKDQTIDIPEIKTTAKDNSDGDKKVEAKKKVTIVDTVEYKGLVPMKKYTVKGVLMDKETGKELLINGKKVTAEKTFTAKKSDGKVDISFKFDASSIEGKKIVVFEEVYYGKALIATHADINDEGQTVEIVKPEVPTSPQTGDRMDLLLWSLFAGTATIGLIVALAINRKRHAEDNKIDIM